jgi:hypothetical protein
LDSGTEPLETELPHPGNHLRLARLARAAMFLLGLVAIVAVLYRIGVPHYQTPKLKAEKLRLADAKSAKVLIFGNSHALDIVPELGGFRGTNFGRGGQDLFELAHTARYVLPRAPQAKTVLISLSYFSFAIDNAAHWKKGVQTHIGRRLHTYSAFPRLDFIEGDTGPYLKGLLYPLVTSDHWARPLTGAAAVEQEDDEEEKVVRRSAAQLGPITKRRVRSYVSMMKNMKQNNPEVAQKAYATLRGLIEEMKARGVTVVLFTAPYWQAYCKQFPKKYRRELAENAKELSTAMGVPYYDFSDDSKFSDAPELFANADHLNVDGKRIFSKTIAELPEIRRLK